MCLCVVSCDCCVVYISLQLGLHHLQKRQAAVESRLKLTRQQLSSLEERTTDAKSTAATYDRLTSSHMHTISTAVELFCEVRASVCVYVHIQNVPLLTCTE